MLISQNDLDKLNEITRLHDEAFWHLHKFDGHAKSSDGSVSLQIEFGNVWERQEGAVPPRVGVSIYSYVVASDTPSYPNFGDRSHYFETIDQALEVMVAWHSKALSYNPTEQELQDMHDFAQDIWEVIRDKTTIFELRDGESTLMWPPESFRDRSNGE